VAGAESTGFNRVVQVLEDIIGPNGRLSGVWPEYEHRPGQLEMATAAAWAFAQDDVVLVEAGTGTGKTLAYLLPALLSQKKTIISTGTKNLQEQIFHKDIPFIRDRLGADVRAAYLKGRENYLCLYYYQAFIREPFFTVPEEALYFDRLREWAQTTETGDRAELIDFPEEFLAWTDLSAPHDRCLGSKCPQYQDCFLQKARRKAAASQLVVVNHHLFMADLSVRSRGHSEVIPDYEAVVFDEAHQLEDVATQYFGLSVSTWRLQRLRRDVERGLAQAGRLKPVMVQTLMAVGHQTDALARLAPQAEEIALWGEDDSLTELRRAARRVEELLGGLTARLEEAASEDDELESLANRALAVTEELGQIIEADDSDFVYWSESRGRGVFLRASPIDVAPFLQDHLYARALPLVFTSATLATGGSFDYFKERMGLLEEIEGQIVDSPFDYAGNTLLYVPKKFPTPNNPRYLERLTDEVERLLKISQGRAFVLFTSYRNMNHVSQAIRDRLPWPCLVQGEAPRTALLDRFRQDIHSVLLATHSFWQGVDVPGESLSAVIIDKLPFPRPDRPLIQARSQRIKEQGQDPFLSYSVPDAIITLKQGLGRLIRSNTDRGILAVLDVRLISKGYGKKFIKSLPPSPLTHNPQDLEGFFEDGSAAS
jgi:ATP-dependent DNA helicase DinG